MKAEWKRRKTEFGQRDNRGIRAPVIQPSVVADCHRLER